ncbi:MAG: hypothetical protein HDR19_00495 [Lachnospiraceae bacterium]|nr:hypothetical protein [Lachnospiraceae bacterium]
MKLSRIIRIYLGILVIIVFGGKIVNDSTVTIYAKEETIIPVGVQYEFDKDSHYEFENAEATKTLEGSGQFGKFSVSGNMKSMVDVNGVAAYEVIDENVSLSYVHEETSVDENESNLEFVDDKTKVIAGIEIDSNIMQGALVLQSSMDGENWVTDFTCTDIAGDAKNYAQNDFYITKDLQQINGCFYRVIVAYETRIKLEDKKGTLIKRDDYEYTKYAEVYEFYLINEDETSRITTSAETMPRKEFSDKVNIGKDTGYDMERAKKVDKDDPHFGWNLGTFTVNGYTRETTKENEDIVFLKTVGDDITLWFTLEQDINCLNGDSNLSISEDKNGYDKNYEIKQTDFKHGTLIVKYTDEQGKIHDPVIYTDFLAANAKTGADTKIQIYEEGEYEVALDYEIKNNPRQVGPVSVVPTYTNYKMSFRFSIRNGNTMVFPMDLETGSELEDGMITLNGFLVDLAQSKYLTIDVSREILKVNSNGTVYTDVRNNSVGKDNGKYSEEGIYTITVKNLYSDEQTQKTIYVGDNKYLRALAENKFSIDALNEKILQGYDVADDGSLIVPPKAEDISEIENTENKREQMHEMTEESAVQTVNLNMESKKKGTEVVNENNQAKDNSVSTILYIVGGLAVVVFGILYVLLKRKNR